MSKETAKRVTFEQLVAHKSQRDNDKLKVRYIYVPSLDATMLFKKISDDKVLDIMTDAEIEGRKGIIKAYRKLIYLCCEDLQDTELHNEIGATDPFDTVELLFPLKDIVSVGEELVELLDLDEASEQVKN